jgi:hypothetical protein
MRRVGPAGSMATLHRQNNMSLKDLLEKNKKQILEKWFHLMINTYPAETAKFLKREKNPFANPVGRSIHEGISGIYDQVVGGIDHDALSPFLDRIIRVRAVQDLSPAQAVAFVFDLRSLVREEFENEIRENEVTSEELSLFDSTVDALALLSFNVYTECREKLFEIRVEEIKNRTFRLLQRSNLLEEIKGSEEESGKDGDNDNQK